VKPLRIALNHTRLAASGGVEGYLWNLLHYLLDRGHEVDFFAGRFAAALEHPRLRLLRVSHLRSPRPLRVASFAASSRRAIAREEERRPYDLVQGFSRTWYHTVYRDGSGCRADYRRLYLEPLARRGLRRLYYRFDPTDRVTRAIERRRYVTRPQRLVIAISRFVRDQILGRYPEVDPQTVRVIYSGVDCERFHPRLRDAGREKLRALAGGAAPPGCRHLLFAGNDYRRKGLDLALEALVMLARAPGVVPHMLAVAGADAQSAAYERRARELGLAERVRFLGPRQDLPELLAGADALLLPTHFDAFSNVATEALASGTPAIVSPTCGAAEVIRPGHGRVLERNDAESLAAALRELLSTADLEPHRRAARAAALAFSWEKHYPEVEAAYREASAVEAGRAVSAARAAASDAG
jgi:UDP-glucose:(heptosyl)LPS alpha-1,3-glucosyltransferase